jgi:hypothetical protein
MKSYYKKTFTQLLFLFYGNRIRDDIGAKSGFYFRMVLLWLALKFSASTSYHYIFMMVGFRTACSSVRLLCT